ncbi:hypothetical protein RRG08_061863 [Elysia crispata]|uniref:Uncharacterized protein n=1 Tax=Elysia crispata TaxID=231223 RepID=A0AAE0XM08_9GAST|nr:hypothetical protein RRG08_061863 [Elysia crispata]
MRILYHEIQLIVLSSNPDREASVTFPCCPRCVTTGQKSGNFSAEMWVWKWVNTHLFTVRRRLLVAYILISWARGLLDGWLMGWMLLLYPDYRSITACLREPGLACVHDSSESAFS